MKQQNLDPSLEAEFRKKNIDRELTLSILDRFNRGEFDHFKPVQVDSLPHVDGEQIIDMTGKIEYACSIDRFRSVIEELFQDSAPTYQYGRPQNGNILLSSNDLYHIGMRLLSKVAYGILNGGSASSYVDEKKNRSFSSELYSLVWPAFEGAAEISRGKPKGVTPAFINPDGSPGPSFLELKMRALLLQSMRYRRAFGPAERELLPIFQMTSIYTDEEVNSTLRHYRSSPFLRGLDRAQHPSIFSPYTAVQPLIAAYTHSCEGRPKRLFTNAWDMPNTLLPLPGGHGQNFAVLADIYRNLYRQGYRYAYLGNIDNLGNTVDPVSIALLALSGRQAAFEFSFKTPVDVKGGILVKDQYGKLNAADIGPAISKDAVTQAESGGTPILFNCASGIFDLQYLSRQIDRIARELPTRFSDQDKDAGRYSQAEQITWEIIGMMNSPLILGVNKYDRFLASKLLLENLMTSGIGLERAGYPKELKALAHKLHQGLQRTLQGPYGLRQKDGRWIPKLPEEIK